MIVMTTKKSTSVKAEARLPSRKDADRALHPKQLI